MTDMERFMAKVSPEPNSGCWLWTGAVSGSGYGQFWDTPSRATVVASRWSLEQSGTRIPEGWFACHHCDTKLCVNPKHLFAGDQSDNMIDALTKGRCRGLLTGNENREKTHCPQGHLYDTVNVKPRVSRNGKPARGCRVCINAGQKHRRDAKQAAKRLREWGE